jgi:hypothetical protein
MAGGFGVLGYVGYGPETSGGVAVVPAAYCQALSETLSANFDRYDLFNIIGRLAEPDDRAGVQRIAGDVVAPFHPIVHGHWLKGMFGSASVATAGAPAGFYKHTWKSPTQSVWDNRFAAQPYTFEIFRDVGSAQAYAGVNFNSMEMSISPNGVLQVKCNLIAVSYTNKAPTVASFSTVGVFDFDTCSITIGSAGVADLESMTFMWENGLEGIPTLAGRDSIWKIRRQGTPSNRLSFNVGFEDITYLENFRQQSETTVQIHIMPPGTSYALRLDFPRVVYTAFPTGMGGRGRQTVEVGGQCRYSQTLQSAFQLDLTTTVGSY